MDEAEPRVRQLRSATGVRTSKRKTRSDAHSAEEKRQAKEKKRQRDRERAAENSNRKKRAEALGGARDISEHFRLVRVCLVIFS